jgi:hypothetical protein
MLFSIHAAKLLWDFVHKRMLTAGKCRGAALVYKGNEE